VSDVRELIELAHAVGSDVLLAQGGGGNVSVKSADGRSMTIKASGVRLSELSDGHGYVTTDLRALIESLRDPALAALAPAAAHEESVRRIQATARTPDGIRPSLETGFHAVLPRVVVHTHPVYVNAFACMDGGGEALATALGVEPVIVPYRAPGYALAVEVDRAWQALSPQRRAATPLIVLLSHGLIATATSAGGVLAATREAVCAGERFFGALPDDATAPARPPTALAEWAAALARALVARGAASRVARPTRFRTLLDAASDPERWLCAGALVPDDVVYSGRRVLVADARVGADVWLDTAGSASTGMIIAVPPLGVVLAGPSAAAVDVADEILLAHVLARRLIARRGQVRPLPAAEVDYLLAMESEHYRARVAATATGVAATATGNAGGDACRS
jgi:rhamnose utilization protein RhaD (predicted bifunctional aldolase and dehydrogenase)